MCYQLSNTCHQLWRMLYASLVAVKSDVVLLFLAISKCPHYRRVSSTINVCRQLWSMLHMSLAVLLSAISIMYYHYYWPSACVINYWHVSSTIDMCHQLSTCVIDYRHVSSTIDLCHQLWHVPLTMMYVISVTGCITVSHQHKALLLLAISICCWLSTCVMTIDMCYWPMIWLLTCATDHLCYQLSTCIINLILRGIVW